MDFALNEHMRQMREVVLALQAQIEDLGHAIANLTNAQSVPEPTQEEYRTRADIARQWISINAPFKHEPAWAYYNRYHAYSKYHYYVSIMSPDFTGIAADMFGHGPKMKQGDLVW